MKTRYVCWWKGQEDEPSATPDASHVVEDWSPEGAAEEYAEKRYNDCGEHMDDMTILVRDAAGVVHDVTVTVDFTPTFSGAVKAGAP